MKFEVKEQQCLFNIDLKVYEMEVICKAAYQFIDECYVFFECIEDEAIRATLEYKNDKTSTEIEALGKQFYNELLSQKVRYNVSKDTKNIRELIIGRALYSTCIEVEEQEKTESSTEEIRLSEDEVFQDLEQITTSWFEQVSTDEQ